MRTRRGSAARWLIFSLVTLVVLPPSALAQQATAAKSDHVGWPRQVEANGSTLTIYQPQLDSWQGGTLSGRSAVSVSTPASPTPTFGVAWFTARTSVDKATRVVTLDGIQITKVSFPTATAEESEYESAIRQGLPTGTRTISLDRLESMISVNQAEGGGAPAVKVQNEPPQIIFSDTPAIMVLVDGKPALRQVDSSGQIMRIINTRALLLLDSSSGTYYLYVMDRWVSASSLDGPWSVAANPPAGLDAAKQAAVASKQVDLLSNPEPSAKAELEKGVLPTIYVTTKSAQLVQTDGPPDLTPIVGSTLLQVKNSTDDILLDVDDQDYYVLVSGRWFKSPSLANGPWTYVAADELPAAFAKIPYDSPRGNALVSVSGTPQAKEAVIASSVPQTATVNRSQTQMPPPQYDGAPDFQAIEGTSLEYAVNTSTPVIEVEPGSYYAVVNGVWFTSSSPTEGWAVAASVPPAIYTIPPSSPIYYVTYVKVYGATPEVVYVGYTPGYYGTYVTPAGTVVYGTGYYYPPYVGSVWIGPPVTYGFGAGFAWGAFTGFALGVAAGAYCHPWWGPVGYGYGWGTTNVNINRNVNVYNSYNHWGKNSVVTSGDHYAGHVGNTTFAGTKGGDVYADHNGNVYRRDNGSWQQYNNGSWNNMVKNDDARQNAQNRVQQAGGPQAARQDAENRAGTQNAEQRAQAQSFANDRAQGARYGDSVSSLDRDWQSRQLGAERASSFDRGGYDQRFGGWGGDRFGGGGARFGGGFSRGGGGFRR